MKTKVKCGLRLAMDGEKYAIILKILGNGNVQLKLVDGTETLGKIRMKFKRKGRDVINVGTWVLVGEREYETKKKVCDILEVYTPSEVAKLMETDGDWSLFTGEKLDYNEVQFQEAESINLDTDINFDDI
jgi:initiation factor 1A